MEEKVKRNWSKNRGNALVRTLKIYLKLQHQPYITYKIIMEEHNVTYRTAVRDIEALALAGVPIYDETIDGKKIWRLLKKEDGGG